MKRKVFKVVILLIILSMPLIFYFYFNSKMESNVKEMKSLPLVSYWDAPYFRCPDQDGDSVSGDDLKGFIYVADFFYTHCSSVCPNNSASMQKIQNDYIDNPKVKLISFTIDPERDTKDVLRDYAGRFGAKKDKWYFLRDDSIMSLVEKGFKLPVMKNENPEPGNEFTHTDRIVIVDEEGKIRGFFQGMQSNITDTLKTSIDRLISAPGQ